MQRHRWLADVVAAVHTALIPYTLFGWVVPNTLWLKIHAVFVPVMIVHWWLNRNVCILSNLESYLRYGTWWRTDDSEQGGWVENRVRALTGWTPPPGWADGMTYVALLLSTLASVVHLWRLGSA